MGCVRAGPSNLDPALWDPTLWDPTDAAPIVLVAAPRDAARHGALHLSKRLGPAGARATAHAPRPCARKYPGTSRRAIGVNRHFFKWGACRAGGCEAACRQGEGRHVWKGGRRVPVHPPNLTQVS